MTSYKIFYSALTIILIISVFALALIIVTSETNPIGADTYYHLRLAELYVHGNFTGAWNLMFSYPGFFYPPFFQLIILGPVALSSNPYLGLRILECLSTPLTFLAICWLVWKYSGSKAALFTGFALLASWSFIDGTLQARPESLDLLLFPIVIWAVIETKKKSAGIASTIMAWSHGLAGISSLFGVFIYKLSDKSWRKTLLFTALAVSPVVILSFIFFGGAIHTWLLGQTQSSNPQEYTFWHNPFPWILYYTGLSLLGIPFLPRRHKTQFESLLTYAFVGNTAMLIFWADRWLQYSVIPWSVLYGCGISRLHGWKLYVMIAVSIGYLAFYLSVYLFNSVYKLWWQP
jgi:hypothetical protein